MRGQLPVRAFYSWYLGRLPRALFDTVDRLLTIAAVFVAILAYFNRSLVSQIVNGWEGFDQRWAILPVAVLVVYEMLRLNYERFRERDAVVARLEGRRTGQLTRTAQK